MGKLDFLVCFLLHVGIQLLSFPFSKDKGTFGIT